MTNENKQIEFRLVNDPQVPPLIITMDERDLPKVVINRHHAIWLMLHRNTIPGCVEACADEIFKLLESHLTEQRANELMENEFE